jgi:hypothetical protein
LHTILEIENYNSAIIVAGDGDYFCLIDYLRKVNKLGRIIIPNKHKYSSLLRKFHPFMNYITDLRNKLEYANKKEA